jgi:hypothetical protein
MTMAHKSFIGLLWYSFLDIKGPVLWLITFALAILFRLFPLKTAISLDWVIPLVLFLLVIVLTIGKAAYELFEAASKGLPKLLVVEKRRMGDEEPTFLCLLEPSELFSHGITVSFYYDDGNFETLIGLGIVEHVREDKRIQVKILASATGYEEIMERVKTSESEVIKKVTVKPHVPESYLRLSQMAPPME